MEQSYEESVRWYSKAAEQWNIMARYLLKKGREKLNEEIYQELVEYGLIDEL